MIRNDLKELASILADWAAPAQGTIVYLFGSRVRGDHNANSDVDIYIDWTTPGNSDVVWWGKNNEDYFRSLKQKLPGPLEILEHNEPLGSDIKASGRKEPYYRDRNVVCVWLPPKPI